MKKIKTIFFAFGLIALATGAVAFTASKNVDGDEDKKCSIKIVKIVDGVKTVTDSTFNCSDEAKWVSNLKGMEGSLEKMIEGIMEKGDSSFAINMDIDVEDQDGIKVIKLQGNDGEDVEVKFDFKISEDNGSMKMMMNGEEVEIKMDDIENQIEKLTEKLDVKHDDSGNVEIVIENEEEGGEQQTVKIIKTIGDDGKVVIRKIIDGEEVEEIEMGDEELMDIAGKHGFVFVSEDGELNEINWSKNMSINVEVDHEGGNEKNQFVIITKVTTDKNTEDMTDIPEVSERLKSKELSVNKLKFSPNPNDGKFDLSFKLDEKQPVEIKIFDIQGREVYNEISSNFNGRYTKNIDISENGEGVYLLQIIQGEKVSTSKIVIN